jgi:hypothetical protein
MRWMTGASQEPPHRRLWGSLGKGGALCNRRSTAAVLGPPRPSSITHPEVAPATVTCSYIVFRLRLAQVDSWLGQLGTRHGEDEAFRRKERMGRVGFDSRIFFPCYIYIYIYMCIYIYTHTHT